MTFNEYLQDMREANYLAVDTEGSTNHPFSNTNGVSTSVDAIAHYWPVNHRVMPGADRETNYSRELIQQLLDVLANHSCLVFHNAKHDLRALENLGLTYRGKFYDTMLMAHMVNENWVSKSLDYLSRIHGGQPKNRTDDMNLIIKAMGWDWIPIDMMRPYATNDALITEGLFQNLWTEFNLQGFNGELWDWEQKFTRLMGEVENTGILVDQSLAEHELERGEKIMRSLENELGFKPSSPKELGHFLLDEMKLPVVKRSKKTDKPSFDKEAMKVYDELLQQRDDERAHKILIYRGWLKTTSSNYRPYLELIGPDGRLHPSFKLHGTRTGRLSCEHPNLQQIPRESENDWNGALKKVFIVEQGRRAYELDYSQLEFRLGAGYAKEAKLIEVFNDFERDVFSEMAEELGMKRHHTKTLNYTLQYGGGAKRISGVFGVSLAAARAIIDNYYAKYPGLRKISRYAESRCQDQGYVKYWTGRRRHFPDPARDGHKAFNAVIQGGAFEIVKRAMIRGWEAGLVNEECRLDLQVHDSIRLDIEEGKEEVYTQEWKSIMENVETDFGVKFKVDVKPWPVS